MMEKSTPTGQEGRQAKRLNKKTKAMELHWERQRRPGFLQVVFSVFLTEQSAVSDGGT